MHSVEERLGSQEALHAGLVALAGAVQSGEAVQVGTNVLGVEVELDGQRLGRVNHTLITGRDTRIGAGIDYIKDSFVHNSELGVGGIFVAESSIIIDSELSGTGVINSTVESSIIRNIGGDRAVTRSHVKGCKVVRNPDIQGKDGRFIVTDSFVETYDDSDRPNAKDIDLINAHVTDVEEVTLIDGITVHPSKSGGTGYSARSQKSYRTIEDVIKNEKAGLKRRDRKSFERTLQDASR